MAQAPSEVQRPGLLSVLGHELRNPLAAAMTGVAALGELVDDDDPRRPLVDRARADLDRLARLLNACLDFGRASRPRRESIDLTALVRDLAGRRCQVTAPARGALPVEADPRLIESVVDNLVENALLAGAGEVELETREHRGRAVLRVRDDGPGVPPAIRARLFEPGFSGRGSSGLGLAIAADIVESHGGRIRLLPSERGACFEIELPLVRSARAALPRALPAS